MRRRHEFFDTQGWIVGNKRNKKVFRVHAAEPFKPGETKLLTADDGFPWCAIPPEAFTARGIAMKAIDLTEIDYILDQGTTELYPELHSQQMWLGFSPLHTMGMYLRDEPVGFSYSGIKQSLYLVPKDERERKRAEIGLVHIVPKFRDNGYGSLLGDLTRLRLLALDPTQLITHVYDKSGKIAHTLDVLGYTATGRSDKSGNPEFAKDVRGENKDLMRQQLEERIRRKLSI